jgi:hypothetical protein
MALHKQIKGSGYKQYEDKQKLELTLFDKSDRGRRKRERLIDTKSCNIELPNNLKHFKDRMQKTINIRETLTGSI